MTIDRQRPGTHGKVAPAANGVDLAGHQCHTAFPPTQRRAADDGQDEQEGGDVAHQRANLAPSAPLGVEVSDAFAPFGLDPVAAPRQALLRRRQSVRRAGHGPLGAVSKAQVKGVGPGDDRSSGEEARVLSSSAASSARNQGAR
jgi:hypothetical protein